MGFVPGSAAHIGLITLELSGHLNPSTTLARELIARGHRVTLFARLDGEAKARAAGLGFEALGAAAFPLGSGAASADELGRLEGAAALRYTLKLLSEQSHVLLTDAPERLRAAQLDLLLIDEISPAAEAVAEVLRIPYVTICNALVAALGSGAAAADLRLALPPRAPRAAAQPAGDDGARRG